MQSHLTKRIFRCILANEPISHAACSPSRLYSSSASWSTSRKVSRPPQSHQLSIPRQQRRSMFSFFKKAQEPASVGADSGVDTMMDLERRIRLKARLPPWETVEAAVQAYLQKSSKQGKAIPDTHARLLLQSYKYIFEQQKKEAAKQEHQGQEMFSDTTITSLKDAAKVLCLEDEPVTEDHVKLVSLLLAEIEARSSGPKAKMTNTLVSVLCNQGQPLEARRLLEQRAEMAAGVEGNGKDSEETTSAEQGSRSSLSNGIKAPWRHVLRTFVQQGNEEQALQTVKLAEKYGIGMKRKFAGTLVQLYANKGSIEQMKQWFTRWSQEKDRAISAQAATEDAEMLREALDCCLKAGAVELGNNLVRTVLEDAAAKPTRDEVLVWALKSQKSVDEVDRMLDVMVEDARATRGTTNKLPDVQTINRLVETAIEAGDPYMAERVINLGLQRKIQPDAKTLVLQIEYRLNVGDVDGALLAYKHLQSKDLSSNEHWTAANNLIVALCNSRRHDYETVMNVVADLADQRAPFFAETVSSLCLVHLRRDEFDDLTDLVRTHVPRFSSVDRLRVQQVIADFCFSQEAQLAQIWDAYQLLRNDFDEMVRNTRTKFMQACFARGRGDLATQVFHHMRRHSRPDTMPIAETYVTAFIECAKSLDGRSVETLHNQLKLDFNIDLNTKLRNALMMAYSACEQKREAYKIWEDIVDSKEGPSFNSLHIVFRTCEGMAFGDVHAKNIWQKLQKNNIDIDSTLWASYLAALTATGKLHEAIQILQDAIKAGEVDADIQIIGSMYNVATKIKRGDLVEAWASNTYPQVWRELNNIGQKPDEDGLQLFAIDRSVTP